MKIDWINRLAKWRSVFAGWQLGTRAMSDPESQAVRDHREVTLLMRAELNALAGLLISKGVFTAAELTAQTEQEAEHLCKAYEKKFPGFTANDTGMTMDARAVERLEAMTLNDNDLTWLVEAAGEDQRKLAQVALLLAAHTAMLTMLAADSGPGAPSTEMLYQVTLAMDAIGSKMGIPPSQIMADFRAIVRKETAS